MSGRKKKRQKFYPNKLIARRAAEFRRVYKQSNNQSDEFVAKQCKSEKKIFQPEFTSHSTFHLKSWPKFFFFWILLPSIIITITIIVIISLSCYGKLVIMHTHTHTHRGQNHWNDTLKDNSDDRKRMEKLGG